MSSNLNRFYQILFVISLLWACEEISDFPESGNDIKIPVVEAILTSNSGTHEVNISYTTFLNDTVSSRSVENASVKVWTDSGDTIVFLHMKNGIYKSKPFAVEAEKQYTLHVETPDFKVTSISKPEPVKIIDSLYYRLENSKDSTYHVYLNAGSIDPQNTRYYLIQAFRNNKLVTKGDEIWIFEDKYLDNLNNIEMFHNFKYGDTLDIELQSLTKPVYDYYSALLNILVYNQLSSQNYITNPPKLFKENVLGYFQVSMVSRRRIIVK